MIHGAKEVQTLLGKNLCQELLLQRTYARILNISKSRQQPHNGKTSTKRSVGSIEIRTENSR